MPQVIVSALAQRDLQRLQDFLKTKNRLAARKAGEVIIRAIQQLKTQPDMGRPVFSSPTGIPGTGDRIWRQWLCDALSPRPGNGPDGLILTVRHQKEAGYHGLQE
ncbi:type II toxin-antitoxin system RelE/ParE family toxin [Enterobacter roggenkampii]